MGTLSQDGKPAKTRDSFRLLNTFFFFKVALPQIQKKCFFLMISKNRKSSFSGVWKTKNNYFWMIWKDVFVFFFIRRKRETNIIEKHNIF